MRKPSCRPELAATVVLPTGRQSRGLPLMDLDGQPAYTTPPLPPPGLRPDFPNTPDRLP